MIKYDESQYSFVKQSINGIHIRKVGNSYEGGLRMKRNIYLIQLRSFQKIDAVLWLGGADNGN